MTDDVRVEVDIGAPAQVVYELLTDDALFVRWLGISAELDPRPGGIFRFEIAPGQFCSGRYVDVDPPRRVVFTWGYESDAMPLEPGSTTVEIDIEERGEACLVKLIHRGLEGPMRTMHHEGWNGFLPRLAAVAEGREPGDDPAAPYQSGARPDIPAQRTEE
ncbi:MAG: SRPBCC family protein [Actinomycetota bacterium]